MKTLPLFAMLAALFIQPVQAAPADDISMYAVSLVGSPYRLGGNDPDTGLDCSGLVDHVFSCMPRAAAPARSWCPG
ncbi:MAG: C40 family peptidase [Thiobacillus sp.]|nr:C40 family peptidase [Thiobacillus sp.]